MGREAIVSDKTRTHDHTVAILTAWSFDIVSPDALKELVMMVEPNIDLTSLSVLFFLKKSNKPKAL
jgi:hypothetical protein